jgi:N-succinyldiaminopimelate aminotransferase
MTNPLFANMPVTIFEEMSGLAREHGAINLGQGFPDEPGPLAVREAAAHASIHLDNQYPSSRGTPELRKAVAGFYRRQGLDLNWETEVTVTSGATEALAAAILALVQAGDEVILFQPLYDAYAPLIRLAGGTPRLIALTPPDWSLPMEAVAAAFSSRTRAVILNTPTNPTGVVWSRGELEAVAKLCIAHDVIAICDEVWEAVVFDKPHLPMLALPGMRERTVKIGSAGKLFALTGWKVGWMLAAPELTRVLARAHQFLTFTTPPNLQHAVAYGLENCAPWFEEMPKALAASRDHIEQRLQHEGLAPLKTGGTYFMCVDLKASGIEAPDRAFSLRAVRETGIAAIPVSAFYEADPVTSIIRLCFAKRRATIDEGVARLVKARDFLRNHQA